MKERIFERSVSLDTLSLNEDNRSIDLSVSSETEEVVRWYDIDGELVRAKEILLHGSDNVYPGLTAP